MDHADQVIEVPVVHWEPGQAGLRGQVQEVADLGVLGQRLDVHTWSESVGRGLVGEPEGPVEQVRRLRSNGAALVTGSHQATELLAAANPGELLGRFHADHAHQSVGGRVAAPR